MKKVIKLTIPDKLIKEPIVYRMVTTYNLIPNIQEANLHPGKTGSVILELQGLPADIEKGILFLKEQDIDVEETRSDLKIF